MQAYDGSLHFLPKLLASRKYWRLELWSPHIIGAGKYETLRLIDCMTLMINSMKQNYFLLGKNALICFMRQKLAGPCDLAIMATEMHLNCSETTLLSLQ